MGGQHSGDALGVQDLEWPTDHRWPHPSPTPPQTSPGFAYGSDIAGIGLTIPAVAIAAV
ncbi:hypothetical protein PUR49_06300 [Streptomyces sp. BE147]|uniref:hypothetical protein n=1 Tax=Streptomyces sp. BE147 TaxID=3002524 RepID=UPI002E75E5B4|nr:hypothetical protein [Streptomyces sp. BE147]MEE1736126.1 hypothetical protein [Streptomyces sp. BE147]